MKNKSLVSINDFNREEHIHILDLAEEFEKTPTQEILKDYVVATLFLNPQPVPVSVLRAQHPGWGQK